MADLAVVIVTWNVRDLALQAVRSLLADVEAHGPSTQVIVVDCASSDGTAQAIAQAFPQVQVIVSHDNLGFGRGNNLGICAAGVCDETRADKPKAVYLLNPDTITQPGATRALYDALMRDETVGLVGARLAYGDGSFQHSAFGFPGLRQLWVEFFPTPGRLIEGSFNGRYPRRLYQQPQPFPVDCVLGATMMLRREVIEQTGMFDEQFFMYCEEIDWAWRIRKAGWQVMCAPSAHVTHLGGQSTGQVRPQSVINLWTSRLQLFRKHYPVWKFALACRMITAGMQRKLREPTLTPEVASAYETIARMAQRP
ncbi:MAG: glycosyltransferase family 2 protein [Chloroflexota bacterium]|nr:glycosyltransferase family 2 protein [Chloroflexota bacterium]